jgi:hypothetical protein
MKEKTQIYETKSKSEEIITNTKEIQEIIQKYLENLYSNKSENLEKWTNF